MPNRVDRDDRLRWLEAHKGRKAFLVDLSGCPSSLAIRQNLLKLLKPIDPSAEARFVKNSYLRKVYQTELHHSGLLLFTEAEQLDVFRLTDSLRSFRIPRLNELLEVPCLIPKGLTSSRPSAVYSELSAQASTKLTKGLVQFVKPFSVGWRGQKTTGFIRNVCAQFGPRQCLAPRLKRIYSGQWSDAPTAHWRQALYTLLAEASKAYDPWLSAEVAVSYVGTKLPGEVMARFYDRVQELRAQDANGPIEAAVKAAIGGIKASDTSSKVVDTSEPDIDFFL